MEEQEKIKEQLEEAKKNTIVYKEWAMIVLTVIQYAVDVIMTPVRSLIFGPQERMSLKDRLGGVREQNMENTRNLKEEMDNLAKNADQELAKEEIAEKSVDTAEKRAQALKLTENLKEYGARADVSSNGQMIALYGKNGDLITITDDISKIDIKDLEKMVTQGKGMHSSGQLRDYDKISNALEAAFIKCNLKQGEEVSLFTGTTQGLYGITVSPVYQKASGAAKATLHPSQVLLQVVKDGKEVFRGMPTYKLLDSMKEQMIATVMKEVDDKYQKKTDLDLQITPDTLIHISNEQEKDHIVIVGENDRTEKDYDLTDSKDIIQLGKDLKTCASLNQKEGYCESLAEILSMAVHPREINTSIDSKTFTSGLDEKLHATRDSYVFVRENQTSVEICYSEKQGAENIQPGRTDDIGTEKVKTVLNIPSIQQLSGEQIKSACDLYHELKEKSQPISKEYDRQIPLHTFSDQTNKELEVTDWSAIISQVKDRPAGIDELEAVSEIEQRLHDEKQHVCQKTQQQAADLVEKISDIISEDLCEYKVKGKNMYREAFLDTIYYNVEKDTVFMEIGATNGYGKVHDFTVELNINEQNENGKPKYYMLSDNKDVRVFAKDVVDTIKSDHVLTDDLIHYLKMDALEKEAAQQQKNIEVKENVPKEEMQVLSEEESLRLEDLVSGKIQIPGYEIETTEIDDFEDFSQIPDMANNLENEEIEVTDGMWNEIEEPDFEMEW